MKESLDTLLRRKRGNTIAITIRLPRALHERIEQIRSDANCRGYDIDLSLAIEQYLDRIAALLAQHQAEASPIERVPSGNNSADKKRLLSE